MTYNPNIPQAADIISNSQPELLSNFQQLDAQFSTDHVAFSATTNNGFHKKVTYDDFTSPAPTPTGSQGVAYTEDNGAGAPRELFKNSQNTFLNSAVLAMGEFNQTGTVISWGYNLASVSAAGSLYTLTFSSALANTNFLVLVNALDPSIPSVGWVVARTTANFQVKFSRLDNGMDYAPLAGFVTVMGI